MPSTLQLIKSDLKRKQEIFHQDGAEISLFRTCLTVELVLISFSAWLQGAQRRKFWLLSR